MDSKKANSCKDFLQFLGRDVSFCIMSLLDDPADLLRASSVSRFWHQFVVENGFAKELCFKTIWGCSNFIIDIKKLTKRKRKRKMSTIELEHEVYATLLYMLQKPDIDLSLNKKNGNYSWNFADAKEMPVIANYKTMLSGVCAITGICYRICPPGMGNPEALRFKIGHSKIPNKLRGEKFGEEKILEWIYTSQEFPIKPDFELLTIKLPQPVLCNSPTVFLKVEFLGLAQYNSWLYLSAVAGIKISGHRKFPAFGLMRPPPLMY